MTKDNKTVWIGILLAVVTVIIWSGNYVVARGIIKQVPPISTSFYRWFTATICLFPFAFKQTKQQWPIVRQHKAYFFWAALTGIGMFNTFIYLAGHYTTAINLALIGTTAAPVFATILAAIFLKEKFAPTRFLGMAICFAGILYLLSQGSLHKLMNVHFGKGDLLIVISALSFAVYNILVKVKPAGMAPNSFLFVVIAFGTVLIFPFYLYELFCLPPVHCTKNILATFLYLGIGNSVIGFLCWNAAIARLGAARTVLFAHLIPIFSAVEAVIFLQEAFTATHMIAASIIIAGLVVANLKTKPRP